MEKSRIKLIALDIDGTIMNKQFQISDRMKNTILKAVNSDINVILATGRMYSATVPIATEVGVRKPLIIYQGSLIREFYMRDDILLQYHIDSDLAMKIINELRNFEIQTNVYLDDELFVEDESHILQEYARRRHISYHLVDSFDNILDFKPIKILGMGKSPEETDRIRDHLKEKFDHSLNITKSTPTYCEVVNNKASKGDAILFLAKMWNINKSEIMVIGDQDNDYDMLRVAGLGVAMGNGTDRLKEVANYITDTVDNDGAALAIEKFALE